MRKAPQDSPEDFVSFDDWIGGRTIGSVGTNAGAEVLPFQAWRHFKESFAPELIQRAVSESAIPVRHCCDPFGGSGRTALACQFLGVRPTTIEVNPFLADLIEAKLAKYPRSLARDYGALVRAANKRRLNPVKFYLSRRPFPLMTTLLTPTKTGIDVAGMSYDSPLRISMKHFANRSNRPSAIYCGMPNEPNTGTQFYGVTHVALCSVLNPQNCWSFRHLIPTLSITPTFIISSCGRSNI